MSLNFSYEGYVAIIGDIVNSKKIIDRKAVQQKYRKALDNINDDYSEAIAAKFSITLGDEFQGLLKSSKNIIKIVSEIEMAMDPIELRFGIGIGKVSTDIFFESTSEVDGPAYHRARKMIKEIASKESQYTERQSNIMISSNEDNIEIDELLNSILSVCTALKSKWTNRQKEIIYAYLSNAENQYKTADSLNIAQSSVNKSLRGARFYSYQSALETVNSFLGEERGKTND